MSATTKRPKRRIAGSPASTPDALLKRKAANDRAGTAKTATVGRPKKSAQAKLSVTKSSKYTPADALKLAARAHKAGMTESEFQRHMSLHGTLVVRRTVIQSNVDENLAEQLLAAGQHFNSIAKNLNAGRAYVPADLQTALATYRRLTKQMKPLNLIEAKYAVQLISTLNNLNQIKRALMEFQSFIPEALGQAIKVSKQLIARAPDMDEAV